VADDDSPVKSQAVVSDDFGNIVGHLETRTSHMRTHQNPEHYQEKNICKSRNIHPQRWCICYAQPEKLGNATICSLQHARKMRCGGHLRSSL
jgi:hypothetical protein